MQEEQGHELENADLDRPRCPVETGYPVLPTFAEPTATRPERSRRRPFLYIYGPDSRISLDAQNRPVPGSPGYVRRVSSHADPVTNMNPDGTPRRSIPPAVPAIQQPVDARTSTVKKTRSIPTASPVLAPPPPPEEDDEIEMLGIHPIVKPPPLAIITLSSDDEDGKPKKSKPKVEKVESVTVPAASSSATSTTAPPTTPSRGNHEEIIEVEQNVLDEALSISSASPLENDEDWELPRGFEFERGTRFPARRKREHPSSRPKRNKKKAKYGSKEFVSSSEDSDSSNTDGLLTLTVVDEAEDAKAKRKRKGKKK